MHVFVCCTICNDIISPSKEKVENCVQIKRIKRAVVKKYENTTKAFCTEGRKWPRWRVWSRGAAQQYEDNLDRWGCVERTEQMKACSFAKTPQREQMRCCEAWESAVLTRCQRSLHSPSSPPLSLQRSLPSPPLSWPSLRSHSVKRLPLRLPPFSLTSHQRQPCGGFLQKIPLQKYKQSLSGWNRKSAACRRQFWGFFH